MKYIKRTLTALSSGERGGIPMGPLLLIGLITFRVELYGWLIDRWIEVLEGENDLEFEP
jgi:hypothetical protein